MIPNVILFYSFRNGGLIPRDKLKEEFGEEDYMKLFTYLYNNCAKPYSKIGAPYKLVLTYIKRKQDD